MHILLLAVLRRRIALKSVSSVRAHKKKHGLCGMLILDGIRYNSAANLKMKIFTSNEINRIKSDRHLHIQYTYVPCISVARWKCTFAMASINFNVCVHKNQSIRKQRVFFAQNWKRIKQMMVVARLHLKIFSYSKQTNTLLHVYHKYQDKCKI